jgi:predicted transposase YbfD/YdcC
MIQSHLTDYSFVDSENIHHANVINYLIPQDDPLLFPRRPDPNTLVYCSYENKIEYFEIGHYVDIIRLKLYELYVYNYTDKIIEQERENNVKQALCWMYSQNSKAFDEMIETSLQFEEVLNGKKQLLSRYSIDADIIRRKFNTFYGDIITFVNSQNYVLK